VTTSRGVRSPDGEIESIVAGGHVDGHGATHGASLGPCSLAEKRLQNGCAFDVKQQRVHFNDSYETWVAIDGPQKGQADAEE
jgi:hypothetical protein